MTVFDNLGEVLRPHADKLANTIHHGLRRIEERVSDLQKVDVGDKYAHITRKGTFSAREPLRAQVGGRGESGPQPGEIWLFQCACLNGAAVGSPAFTIRTNTGRLILAAVKEGIGMETPGGDVPIQFGEELIFEPSAGGEFDFTITFRRVLISYPQRGNAIGGVSNERHDRPSHGVELGERQMQQVPWEPDSPWHSPTPGHFPNGQEEFGGGPVTVIDDNDEAN